MVKRNLTRTEIVERAIRLLEEEGFEGLSMRRLAQRLQVQAPTLYYHISDKSALLGEVLVTLFRRSFERMPQCQSWQEWMRAFAAGMWDVQQEEKFTPALILNTPLDDTHFHLTIEMIREGTSRFDVDQEQLFQLQTAVQATIVGWSTFAHAAYADKVGRFVDFRDAALDSVDALIEQCEKRLA